MLFYSILRRNYVFRPDIFSFSNTSLSDIWCVRKKNNNNLAKDISPFFPICSLALFLTVDKTLKF